MQYVRSVARRHAYVVAAGGERFRFYYDRQHATVLHITLQHHTTPEDAVRTFFEGTTALWDEAHQRYETVTETHGIYWTHAHDQSVIIISCFKRGDE